MYFEKAGGTWIPAFAGKTGGGRGEKNIFRRKRKNMSYIIMRNCAKFLRGGMVIVFAAGFFTVFAGEAEAATCKFLDSQRVEQAGECKLSSQCAGESGRDMSGACEVTREVCCKTPSSSTCNASYCKNKCDSSTDDTTQTACNSVCTESGKTQYCPPKNSGGDGGGGTSSPVNITLVNPLKYNTVQQVLMALLYALQGVIVVLSLVFIVIGAVLYITSAGNQARVTSAKTAITAALIGLAIGILAPTFLKEIATVLGWNATAPLPAEVSGARSAADILLSVLNFLLGIVGILAIIFLVVGAIMFLGATGDMNRIGVAKKIIQYALLGIVVALASLVIVRQLAEFFAPATT